MISSHGLLYIEPAQPASTEPVLDHLTRKMAAAFCQADSKGMCWCGFHVCMCGALSGSDDFLLPNGEETNSLCVHYVAHHRSEVPSDQLSKIEALSDGEVEPTDEELQGPPLILERVRASVESYLRAGGRLNTWTRWGLDVDRLSHNLRGGVLPAGQGVTSARRDAEDLMSLLCSIEPESLAYFQLVVEQEHRDMRQWGEQALRIPAWDRGLWVSPLVALIERSQGMVRRSVAMHFRRLGSVAAAAVPTLIRLAKTHTSDRDLQYDLSLALTDLSEVLGVSLLEQIPPQPGQLGTCSYCQASGDCYCQRVGMANFEQCARCNGSRKCHVCHGTGRLRK